MLKKHTFEYNKLSEQTRNDDIIPMIFFSVKHCQNLRLQQLLDDKRHDVAAGTCATVLPLLLIILFIYIHKPEEMSVYHCFLANKYQSPSWTLGVTNIM